jgi:hypothetical protein
MEPRIFSEKKNRPSSLRSIDLHSGGGSRHSGGNARGSTRKSSSDRGMVLIPTRFFFDVYFPSIHFFFSIWSSDKKNNTTPSVFFSVESTKKKKNSSLSCPPSPLPGSRKGGGKNDREKTRSIRRGDVVQGKKSQTDRADEVRSLESADASIRSFRGSRLPKTPLSRYA